jgi:hypothetical protein
MARMVPRKIPIRSDPARGRMIHSLYLLDKDIKLTLTIQDSKFKIQDHTLLSRPYPHENRLNPSMVNLYSVV